MAREEKGGCLRRRVERVLVGGRPRDDDGVGVPPTRHRSLVENAAAAARVLFIRVRVAYNINERRLYRSSSPAYYSIRVPKTRCAPKNRPTAREFRTDAPPSTFFYKTRTLVLVTG